MPQVSQWRGEPSVKGSTESMKMAFLTATLIGIQFTWGMEMSYCTPYLLHLGLTKSTISLVWIAGPVSGLIMQPLIGVIADRNTSSWGRRRPFMMFGCVLVAAFLLGLGRAQEIVDYFLGTAEDTKQLRKSLTIWFAVFSIVAIDFSINAVQGSARTLVVDTLPLHKQQLGAAWSSRMVAFGHLLSYAAGAVDLSAIFGTSLGDTQFKQLTAIAAITLVTVVAITSWAVTERVLVADGRDAHGGAGIVETITKIFKTATNLPPRIFAICRIQFLAWFGWFPFLFYTTTWVGEIYMRYDAKAGVLEDGEDILGKVGRVGSRALVVFTTMTFLGSIWLPFLVKSPANVEPAFTPRPPTSIAPLLLGLEKYKPSLLSVWTVTHLIFATAMVTAPFISSVHAATILVAICGLPWIIQCWAPFSFLGMEINRLNNAAPTKGRRARTNRDSVELESLTGLPNKIDRDSSDSSDRIASGIYLGIFNLFTTIPQFLGTLLCWVVFTIMEPGKSPELAKDAHPSEVHSTEGISAIGICLFIGAFFVTGASYATRLFIKMG